MCLHCRGCFITRNRVEADDFSVCLAWHKIFPIPLTPYQGSALKSGPTVSVAGIRQLVCPALLDVGMFFTEAISFAYARADQIGRNKTVARATGVQVLLERRVQCPAPGMGCNYERAHY